MSGKSSLGCIRIPVPNLRRAITECSQQNELAAGHDQVSVTHLGMMRWSDDEQRERNTMYTAPQSSSSLRSAACFCLKRSNEAQDITTWGDVGASTSPLLYFVTTGRQEWYLVTMRFDALCRPEGFLSSFRASCLPPRDEHWRNASSLSSTSRLDPRRYLLRIFNVSLMSNLLAVHKSPRNPTFFPAAKPTYSPFQLPQNSNHPPATALIHTLQHLHQSTPIYTNHTYLHLSLHHIIFSPKTNRQNDFRSRRTKSQNPRGHSRHRQHAYFGAQRAHLGAEKHRR